MPIAALANLTPSQVEAILTHELVHIRRHDFVINVAQTLAETLLFYHPGVWWVSGRIRAEREHCCDDVAVAVCGDAVDYATALAELEAWRSSETILALAATTGLLSDRARRILRVPIGHEPRSLSWVVTLGLTLALGVGVGGIYLPWFGSSTATSAVMASGAQRTEPIASPDTFDWQVYTTSHFERRERHRNTAGARTHVNDRAPASAVGRLAPPELIECRADEVVQASSGLLNRNDSGPMAYRHVRILVRRQPVASDPQIPRWMRLHSGSSLTPSQSEPVRAAGPLCYAVTATRGSRSCC